MTKTNVDNDGDDLGNAKDKTCNEPNANPKTVDSFTIPEYKILSKMYEDPSDIDNVIKKLMNTPTIGDIKLLCDEHLPGWIVDFMHGYSSDYPRLLENHKKISESLKVEKRGIIIVRHLEMSPKHKLLNLVADVITRSGFLIRRSTELFACKKCNMAIPTKQLYDILVSVDKIGLPSKWSDTCSICMA